MKDNALFMKLKDCSLYALIDYRVSFQYFLLIKIMKLNTHQIFIIFIKSLK